MSQGRSCVDAAEPSIPVEPDSPDSSEPAMPSAYGPSFPVAHPSLQEDDDPVGNSFSYVFGPVVALVAIGVLILLLRWAFSSKKTSVVAAAAKPGFVDDYGMLVPIATPATYIEGELLRCRLEDAGIRANLASTLEGPRVLVWPADESRARTIVMSS